MKTSNRVTVPAVLLAVLVAPSVGLAEDPTVESLSRPQSEIEGGLGVVIGDTNRFGMYNGLADEALYPILSGSINQRDDATGTWLKASFANFGYEGGRLRFERERQGNWSYFVEGSRTTFSNPRTIITALNGLGDGINAAAGGRHEVDLDMVRENMRFGGSKAITEDVKFNFSFRRELKDGARQWGAQGFNFAAEPVDFRTDEYQGSVSYVGDRLQIQGGYLGSVFVNDLKALRETSAAEPVLSLPLDNAYHQVFVNGGYSFSPTTRGTFNASYGRLFQNDDFFTAPTFAGNTRTDLGGKVDNTQLNLGLSSRPITDVSTRVKLRYDERNDNTPLAQYVAASATRTGQNVPFSRRTGSGDVEADYKLPMQFKLIGGLNFEHWDRSSPPLRHTAFRKETDEASARIGLRRPLTDELSGSATYVHSERWGTSLQNDGTNLQNPILWADRTRDKGRFALDWAPTNAFSMQFIGEIAWDSYGSRDLGPQNGRQYVASIDGNYRITDDWDATAWVSVSETKIEQRAFTTTAPTTAWQADLSQVGKAAGVGLRGRVTDRVKLSADLQYTDDTSEHDMSSLSTVALPRSSVLPDIEYRQWLLGLTGDYAIQDGYGIKLKYTLSHIDTDDWSWSNFVYADGTTVRFPDRDLTHFVGMFMYLRW